MFRATLAFLCLTVGSASAANLDAKALAARIDERIGTRLAKDGVPAAPLAEDAEFFRRLSLDLNGRIPAIVQLRDYLDDRRPNKRHAWVQELIEGRENEPLYIAHFANAWRRTILAHTPGRPFGLANTLEGWLRKQVKANASHDRIVRGLLTDPEANSFFTINENKPENVASAAARLFLGVKIECAQCHNHPFARWTRQQFWEQAAFFSSLAIPGARTGALLVAPPQDTNKGPARIKIADSESWADARFLDGSTPNWKTEAPPRQLLADWITRRDNPWYARAAVNRLWHHFFGVGLIEPVDGLGSDESTPSHPELLDELAEQFVAHNFDLKYLITAIATSDTYARSSRQTHEGQSDPRRFARAQPRGLTPEQLFDSLTFATGYQPSRAIGGDYGPFSTDSLQSQFLAKFDDPLEQPAEAQTSIPQALLLMNGTMVNEATDPTKSRTLAAVLSGGAKRTMTKRIEELFLATLSRPPRPAELQRFLAHVNTGEPATQLRDVLWALLNSTEFALNH